MTANERSAIRDGSPPPLSAVSADPPELAVLRAAEEAGELLHARRDPEPPEPGRRTISRRALALYVAWMSVLGVMYVFVPDLTLIAFALIWLVPIAWTVDTALKPNAETTNPTWAIQDPTLASYRALLGQGDIWNWYASSFITSTLTAAVTVLTASMAAFALSRMRFRYRWPIFWFRSWLAAGPTAPV